jgi:hypothetical protein
MLATGLSAGTAALALAFTPPLPVDSNAEIPGGYHDMMALRGVEPPDGDSKITLGSVLFSLGMIQFAGGLGSVVTALPQYCSVLNGPAVAADNCHGLRIYGVIGATFGGLMAASGGVILGMGLIQRRRHRQWLRDAGLVLAPLLGPGQRGLSLGFRF